MHDAVLFEAAGLPSVVIITDAFTQTAAGSAALQGLDPRDLRLVVAPHPFARRTEDEMRELGHALASQVADLLAADPDRSGGGSLAMGAVTNPVPPG